MKWVDPMPINCEECGGQFSVAVAVLRTLRAVCPGCGASLATVSKFMLDEDARFGQLVGLIDVAIELDKRHGLFIPNSELDDVRSLEDLVLAVISLLDPTVDREARAAQFVTDAARRVAPQLLVEADSAE